MLIVLCMTISMMLLPMLMLMYAADADSVVVVVNDTAVAIDNAGEHDQNVHHEHGMCVVFPRRPCEAPGAWRPTSSSTRLQVVGGAAL